MFDIVILIELENMNFHSYNSYSFVLINFELVALDLEVETIFRDYSISNIQIDNSTNYIFSMNLTMSNIVFILFLIVGFLIRVTLCIIFILTK